MTASPSPPSDRTLAFERPPTAFTDERDRVFWLRTYGDAPVEEEFEAIVDFYETYPLEHRSLGVPPPGAERIRRWLERIVQDVCVLAWHDDRPVGQAALVAADGDYELAVFVGPAFQHAGVGTHLLGALLAQGRDEGVDHVWLLVESDNRPAVNLYLDVGFHVVRHRGTALEMERDLA